MVAGDGDVYLLRSLSFLFSELSLKSSKLDDEGGLTFDFQRLHEYRWFRASNVSPSAVLLENN